MNLFSPKVKLRFFFYYKNFDWIFNILVKYILEQGANLNDAFMIVEQWENISFKLNDSKRFRQTIGSIASACLTASTPLLASMNRAACLVALDIVEVLF